MRMGEPDIEWARALAALQAGFPVEAATETFFGLLADATQEVAVDRVLALKGRDPHRGIALLLPSLDAWGSLVTDIPKVARILADRFWPGPLTIALPAQPHVDLRLTFDGTVAVRWAGDSAAARLACDFGAPLTATSANVAGEPACASDEEVIDAFAHVPGAEGLVIVRGRAPGGLPSTLVTVAGDSVRIVREGQVSRNALAAVVPASALG